MNVQTICQSNALRTMLCLSGMLCVAVSIFIRCREAGQTMKLLDLLTFEKLLYRSETEMVSK